MIFCVISTVLSLLTCIWHPISHLHRPLRHTPLRSLLIAEKIEQIANRSLVACCALYKHIADAKAEKGEVFIIIVSLLWTQIYADLHSYDDNESNDIGNDS